MDMIFLHIERTYRPAVGFTDAAEFLLDKRGKLARQNLLAVLGAPDKVVSYLVGNMFGMLCIHTQQYNICSNLYEVPVGAAASPYLSSRGCGGPPLKDWRVGFKLVQPFLIAAGVTTEEEFDALYQQMVIEMMSKDFSAVMFLLTVVGEKPMPPT
jgi:hypothetical protein